MLYLLFEHQTSVDPAMPLRLLGYIVEILQQHQRRHGGPWPLVFPFVLNQGPDRWTVSENFEDGFAMGVGLEGMLPYLPKFRYALLDLTELDPDRDEDHDELRLALQLMKLVRLRKQVEFLAWLEHEFSRPGLTVRLTLMRTSFVYLLHTDAVMTSTQSLVA